MPCLLLQLLQAQLSLRLFLFGCIEFYRHKTIEYKAELHIDTGDDRKEFLADVTSFANSNGGDLIYGIQEDREKISPVI